MATVREYYQSLPRGVKWLYILIGIGLLTALVRFATGLGATAIVFHFFWWMALLVAGVLIIVAIIENIGDIFSFS